MFKHISYRKGKNNEGDFDFDGVGELGGPDQNSDDLALICIFSSK